ncbi:PVC-type heme-binding CxxCH protein [Aquiflexum sp.]|uniref:PVC-type heme-binding CxxCH protein n=1 Tax=Aquiflexum sp. TaxID=1872584 RepID=UPI003593F970
MKFNSKASRINPGSFGIIMIWDKSRSKQKKHISDTHSMYSFNLKPQFINLLSIIFLTMHILFSCKPNDSPKNDLPEGVRLLDDRLVLSVVVEEPDIVTPIGIAIDDKDRLYVLESHTHLPPKDYQGLDGDLIKVFEDTNDDGNYDKISVFAEGIKEGMNLAFSHEGHLHLVTSREVWVFYDRDGDGVCEEKKKLMELKKPESVYAHAAMLSITFSDDGFMYLGRGNTGSENWIFEGSDGSQISGYGDGGNVIRAKWDGSQVEEFSTGYWNPFDLKFDSDGRLLVADNDPDSRGPNRLVHAVYKSDFGYKTLFGGSGIHPYLAWNGELPGTLPMAVPLGEAPSGLLNASLTNLPQDYQNQMLCTIWEESTIVRIDMQENGFSVTGKTEVIVEGGEDFRPVAFAVNSKGEIYFTDWVVRYYPNHGRGKIWKLSSKDNDKVFPRNSRREPSDPNNWEKMMKSLDTATIKELRSNLKSDDPFQKHAGIMVLSKKKEEIKNFAKDQDSEIRLGALLAARKSGDNDLEMLAKGFLTDTDLQIRKMALIWIGSSQMVSLKNEIGNALTVGPPSNDLFETYLETVKLLQPDFVNTYQNQLQSRSQALKRELPGNFVSKIVQNNMNPIEMRVYALRFLDNPQEHKKLLISFLAEGVPDALRLETIRTLQNVPDKEVSAKLLELALEASNSATVRSDALAGLSRQPLDDWNQIVPLLESEEENLRIEATRFLRAKIGQPDVKEAFEKHLNKSSSSEGFQHQLQLGLDQELSHRPDVADEKSWYGLLDGNGDSERGRRVFFSNTALCSTCHVMDGRGGDLGPDLSNVGKSKDRNNLIASILYPSAEMSPEWQGWYIKLNDGTLEQGRQIDVGNNDIKLYTQAKGFISVQKEEIADYGMIKESLMPDGLEERLTDQDLRDLLAYLGSFD